MARPVLGTVQFFLLTLLRPSKHRKLVASLLVGFAVLCGAGVGSARADDECGGGKRTETTTEITCDASTYDPSVDGNIVYRLGEEAADRDNVYRVHLVGLSGERAVTLDNSLDSPHRVPTKPSAVWLDHVGYWDFTVDVSDIELKTGLTETTGTYVVPGRDATAGFRGLTALQKYIAANSPYPNPTGRHLFLNIRDSEFHTYSRAINAWNGWNGAINVDVRDTRIQTYGPSAHGIVVFHEAIGDVSVHAERVHIEAVDGDGLWGVVRGLGWPDQYSGPATINLTVKDSNIKVGGESNTGFYASHYGSGRVEFVLENSRVEAAEGSFGMWIRHNEHPAGVEGADLEIAINIKDGEIATATAHGILIERRFADSTGTNTITIGSVVRAGGEGHGIFAQGDTVVIVDGLVGAESGNAITNEGGDLDLRIEANGQIDGLVSNETGYETNIRVGDDVVVQNGEVVRRSGAAGAFDTTIRETEDGYMADRQYGARVAVYESIVGTLLGLNSRSRSVGEPIRSPDSPAWVSIGGGTGSYEPKRSTVGGEFDLSRYDFEAGIDLGLNEVLVGTISGRAVLGSADVSAPIGGGTIDADGFGLSAGLAWKGGTGLYGKGRLSAMWFDMDLESAVRGTLEEGVDSSVRTLDLEAGYQFSVGESTTLTPRAWLTRSDVSVHGFTDAVGAKVSIGDADLSMGGIGAVVETELGKDGAAREVTLRGSLGIERKLSGGDGTTLVSGEQLNWTGQDSRILVGLGLTRRWGDVTFGADLRADGLSSKNHEYAGHLSLHIPFK